MTDLAPLLAALAEEIDWPEPSTGFATRVVARIGAEPAHSPRRLMPALGAVAAVLAVAFVLSPGARDAVADFVGLGGVHIRSGRVEASPRPGDSLDLGKRIGFPEAEELVDFHVFVPGDMSKPPETYYDPIVPGGMVSLVYPSGDEVDVLITEFEGRLVPNQEFFTKMLGPDASVQSVDIAGVTGYWISGAHSFAYRTGGTMHEESLRLVENVLLWVRDGVTLRIETAGSLQQALRVAESFR